MATPATMIAERCRHGSCSAPWGSAQSWNLVIPVFLTCFRHFLDLIKYRLIFACLITSVCEPLAETGNYRDAMVSCK